ncbi:MULTISPECIES: hypothetical protein [Brevibacterium]|uniref:hypothetical protein n=1 Tax=Brevibacterium TaxID=1696 RepID=UPI0011BE759C|nr:MULTISPECIES: hypothetical protein [Brevibacterium]
MSELQDLEDFFMSVPASPRFTKRSVSIPGDFRTSWRLSVLSLLLAKGRSKSLALPHLHVLWWAIRTSRSRSLFLKWFEGKKSPDELLVRFDPSLTVAVDLALGQGLAERTATGLIKLTETGSALAESVKNDSSVLVTEKAFLANLPKSINQRRIRELLEWT